MMNRFSRTLRLTRSRKLRKKYTSHNISDKSFNRNEIERQLLETGEKEEVEEVVV